MGISQKDGLLEHLGTRENARSKDRAATSQDPYLSAIPRPVVPIGHAKAGLIVAGVWPEQNVACIFKLQEILTSDWCINAERRSNPVASKWYIDAVAF